MWKNYKLPQINKKKSTIEGTLSLSLHLTSRPFIYKGLCDVHMLVTIHNSVFQKIGWVRKLTNEKDVLSENFMS